ncbi:MAG: phosphatase PAP2 family protein [Parasporobacterium sp.]|nr:phosphatase PAP2 family protein [Parasporobacterium sp.]
MSQERTLEIISYISARTALVKAFKVFDKVITYCTVLLYVAFLIYATVVGVNGDFTLLARSIIIPGVSFILVSLFRKALSAKRPYEVYDFKPVLDKDTVGKSFPSRHVFSIFMISMVYLQVSLVGALLIGVMGLILALVRVLTGVHFVRDVIAGALVAFAFALLGALII